MGRFIQTLFSIYINWPGIGNNKFKRQQPNTIMLIVQGYQIIKTKWEVEINITLHYDLLVIFFFFFTLSSKWCRWVYLLKIVACFVLFYFITDVTQNALHPVVIDTVDSQINSIDVKWKKPEDEVTGYRVTCLAKGEDSRRKETKGKHWHEQRHGRV